jgi:hypothetical protein
MVLAEETDVQRLSFPLELPCAAAADNETSVRQETCEKLLIP